MDNKEHTCVIFHENFASNVAILTENCIKCRRTHTGKWVKWCKKWHQHRFPDITPQLLSNAAWCCAALML